MGARTKLTAAVVAAAALAVGAVAAIADEEEQTQPPGSDLAVVTAIETEASDAMAALAAGRNGSDELPSDVADAIGERPLFGMNPDLSRRLIAETHHALFAVPADGHVCTVLTDSGTGGGAIGCPATADVAAGESAPGTVVLATGDIGVYGLVPDGVEEVILATGVTDTDEVEVVANGYFAVVEAETPLRHVAYVGPSGPVQFPIHDPTLGEQDEEE